MANIKNPLGGMISAVNMVLLLVLFFGIRVYEQENQIRTVLSLYKISKAICGLMTAITLICWLIHFKKNRKVFSIYLLTLFFIPVFYLAANGRIPGRYEKLYRVDLIREGKWEQLKETMDYFVYNRTEYGGESGNEDVLFMPGREKRTDDAYYCYAYLYSNDEKLDAYTGVWESTGIWHIEGRWYKVELRLLI